MDKGIIFLIVFSVMILSQLFVQAADRKKKHNEIIEKLNLIITKLN